VLEYLQLTLSETAEPVHTFLSVSFQNSISVLPPDKASDSPFQHVIASSRERVWCAIGKIREADSVESVLYFRQRWRVSRGCFEMVQYAAIGNPVGGFS
jgi:hypothetical protein